MELTILVFRTHKGDIANRVLGKLTIRNPDTGVKVELPPFYAKKFAVDTKTIPRTFPLDRGRKLDLFKDLVTSDGRMEVRLECLEPGQCFGAAKDDVYLHTRDMPFEWNFVKGYVGMWLQVLLLITFGVMFSTFLSGPIALVATFGLLVAGWCSDFMWRLGTLQTLGGGPAESLIRLTSGQNLVTPMEPGLQTTTAKAVDSVLCFVIRELRGSCPTSAAAAWTIRDFIVDGFNIRGDLVLIHAVTAWAFFLPVFVLAYFAFKTREVAL